LYDILSESARSVEEAEQHLEHHAIQLGPVDVVGPVDSKFISGKLECGLVTPLGDYGGHRVGRSHLGEQQPGRHPQQQCIQGCIQNVPGVGCELL